MAGTPLMCDDGDPDTIDTRGPNIGCRHGCPGDCDGSDTVSIDELLSIVNIALSGSAGNGFCLAATDANADGTITVDEIINAVKHALHACGDR
jgi:hypothetical protein